MPVNSASQEEEGVAAHEPRDAWRARSGTIQRDPVRILAIAEELVAEIRAQDAGTSDTWIQGGSLECEVSWLAHNMDGVGRRELVRTASWLLMDIALWDLGEESKAHPTAAAEAGSLPQQQFSANNDDPGPLQSEDLAYLLRQARDRHYGLGPMAPGTHEFALTAWRRLEVHLGALQAAAWRGSALLDSPASEVIPAPASDVTPEWLAFLRRGGAVERTAADQLLAQQARIAELEARLGDAAGVRSTRSYRLNCTAGRH
jgi:hypothetical protein